MMTSRIKANSHLKCPRATATSATRSRNKYPIPRKLPHQIVEPSKSKRRNVERGTPPLPASGAATAFRPGTNLVTSRLLAPFFSITLLVRRTHESGSSDTRQISFKTFWLPLLPIPNQNRSLTRQEQTE